MAFHLDSVADQAAAFPALMMLRVAAK